MRIMNNYEKKWLPNLKSVDIFAELSKCMKAEHREVAKTDDKERVTEKDKQITSTYTKNIG